METATEDMQETAEETPAMALFRACRSTATLAHHPDLAPALVGNNVEKVLAHLRQQRQWFSSLTSKRESLDNRKAPAISHARAACTVLANYEQRLRTAVA